MSNTQRSTKSITSLDEEIVQLERDAQATIGAVKEEAQEQKQEQKAVVEDSLLSAEETTFKKRYSDLRSHSAKREKSLQDQIDELKKGGAKPPMPTTTEEIKRWAETNPQAASIIQALAREQAGEVSNDITARVAEIERMKEELALEKEEAKILKKHPDFKELREDEDFLSWAEDQPQRIQDMIFDGTAEEVSYQLTNYKKAKGMLTKEEERETAKRVSSKTSKTQVDDGPSKGRFSESMVDKMTAQEYDEYADAIQAEIRAGTFLFDITGAAR